MTTKSLETLQQLLDLHESRSDVSLWRPIRDALVSGETTRRVSNFVWYQERNPAPDAEYAASMILSSGLGFSMIGITCLVFSDPELIAKGVSGDDLTKIDEEYGEVVSRFLGNE